MATTMPRVASSADAMTDKPFRLRSKSYLDFIRTKPCLICGDRAEAHHLQRAQPRAMALKTGDQFCVPVCRAHHHELHNSKLGESVFWAVNGIDPIKWAMMTYEKWVKEREYD